MGDFDFEFDGDERHFGRVVPFVDISVPNNATWQDTFQFGDPTDFTWDFNNKFFSMDLKFKATDPTAVFSLTSANSFLTIVNAAERVLGMNVQENVLLGIYTGVYVFDLIMTDNLTGVRTPILMGTVELTSGVTKG